MKNILLLIFCVSVGYVSAQDGRFSQFYNAPQVLNPALTGVFDGSVRLNVIYREQWKSVVGNNPFRTYQLGADFRKGLHGGDKLGFGVSVMRDEAGDSEFHNNKAHLSVSFIKELSGGGYRTAKHYMVAGAQVGAGQFGLNLNKLWFSSQFDATANQPDQNLPNNEPTPNSQLYMNINAGLLWYTVIDKDFSIYAGGSYSHINSPNISFNNNNNVKLNQKWVGHAGAQIPLNAELSILPAILLMGQGPSFETNVGTNFRYTHKDWYELAIRAGFWTRFVNNINGLGLESTIVSITLEMDRLNLGVSYDLNTSSLKVASLTRGAYELALTYIIREKSRYKVTCPKF